MKIMRKRQVIGCDHTVVEQSKIGRESRQGKILVSMSTSNAEESCDLFLPKAER